MTRKEVPWKSRGAMDELLRFTARTQLWRKGVSILIDRQVHTLLPPAHQESIYSPSSRFLSPSLHLQLHNLLFFFVSLPLHLFLFLLILFCISSLDPRSSCLSPFSVLFYTAQFSFLSLPHFCLLDTMINKIMRKLLGHDPQVLVVGYEGSGVRTFLSQKINSNGSGMTTTTSGSKMMSILRPYEDASYYPQDGNSSYLIRFGVTICGGNPSMRWQDWPEGAAGVICVVDSSDEKRIELTRVALLELYETHEKILRKSVLLVLANKQDRLNALSVMEVMNRMELERWTKEREWYIQGTDAVSGDGVQEGMDWMAKYV